MTAKAADINVNMQDTGWSEGRAVNLWGGGSISGNSNFLFLYASSNQMLYCIEPGMPLKGGEGLNINDYVNSLHTPSIDQDNVATQLLGHLFNYVDYGATGSPLATDKGKALYIAAQILVWEVTQGERDADFNYVSPPEGFDKVKQAIDDSSMPDADKKMIDGCYDDLVSKVQNDLKVPSFADADQSAAPTYELTGSGPLSITLTDDNNVLSNYDFTKDDGNISFSVEGNQLTVTAQNAFDGGITVTAAGKDAQIKGVICYGDGKGDRQDTVSIGSPAESPIQAYFKVTAAEIKGSIKVIKTDGTTDTPLEGAVFEVMDSGGNVVGALVTDKDGTAVTGPLDAGNYTVKEKTAKDGYVLDDTEHVITILENDKVYELDLQNSETPENPKTGDGSNPALWFLLAGISATVFMGFWAYDRRRKTV